MSQLFFAVADTTLLAFTHEIAHNRSKLISLLNTDLRPPFYALNSPDPLNLLQPQDRRVRYLITLPLDHHLLDLRLFDFRKTDSSSSTVDS